MCTHLVGLALISLFTDLFCVIMTNKTLILSYVMLPRAFAVKAAILWNALQERIRLTDSYAY